MSVIEVVEDDEEKVEVKLARKLVPVRILLFVVFSANYA